jgi:hypothetical protein
LSNKSQSSLKDATQDKSNQSLRSRAGIELRDRRINEVNAEKTYSLHETQVTFHDLAAIGYLTLSEEGLILSQPHGFSAAWGKRATREQQSKL